MPDSTNLVKNRPIFHANKPQIFKLLLLIISGVFILQCIRFLIENRFQNIFKPVLNTDPMGLDRLFNISFLTLNNLNAYLIFLIFSIVLYFIFKYGLHKGKTLGILLLSTGIYSNLVEKIIHKNVLDYFNIGFAIINLADILIILGLIYLNKNKYVHKNPIKTTDP